MPLPSSTTGDDPSGQTTQFTNGAQVICHNDVVIDGVLSAFDEDINLVVEGDLTLNGQILLDGADADLPDGTEGHGQSTLSSRSI